MLSYPGAPASIDTCRTVGNHGACGSSLSIQQVAMIILMLRMTSTLTYNDTSRYILNHCDDSTALVLQQGDTSTAVNID